MKGKGLRKEKIMNVILSAIKFLGVVIALYYIFTGLGIEQDKAVIEALVIGSAIITPVVLYLFGRTWKKESTQPA